MQRGRSKERLSPMKPFQRVCVGVGEEEGLKRERSRREGNIKKRGLVD